MSEEQKIEDKTPKMTHEEFKAMLMEQLRDPEVAYVIQRLAGEAMAQGYYRHH